MLASWYTKISRLRVLIKYPWFQGNKMLCVFLVFVCVSVSWGEVPWWGTGVSFNADRASLSSDKFSATAKTRDCIAKTQYTVLYISNGLGSYCFNDICRTYTYSWWRDLESPPVPPRNPHPGTKPKWTSHNQTRDWGSSLPPPAPSPCLPLFSLSSLSLSSYRISYCPFSGCLSH